MPRLQSISTESPPQAPSQMSLALATMSGLRERAPLLEAVCAAAGELLGLDATAIVRRGAGGVTCSGRWARRGARPNRIGEARAAAALELAERTGGVGQLTFGRLELIVIPITDHTGMQYVVAGTARPLRRLSPGDIATAGLLAAHAAACIEMVARPCRRRRSSLCWSAR